MERSDVYAEDHHWGDVVIDVTAHDLPALKATFLLRALPPRGRVLEIGCGGGRLLNTIAHHRPDLQLDGCDIRPLDTEPETFAFTAVDPDDPSLPYEPDTFDAVILYDVLEHVWEPSAMLASAAQVTKPTGRLVSFTPLEGQPRSAYRVYRKLFGDDLYVETKEHVQAFSETSLTNAVERSFTVDEVEFAYHFVGQVMDATLFAALKVPAVRRRFWDTNPFYRESTDEPEPASALGTMLRAGNALAYWESRLLHRSRVGAAGMLFTATPRPGG